MATSNLKLRLARIEQQQAVQVQHPTMIVCSEVDRTNRKALTRDGWVNLPPEGYPCLLIVTQSALTRD